MKHASILIAPVYVINRFADACRACGVDPSDIRSELRPAWLVRKREEVVAHMRAPDKDGRVCGYKQIAKVFLKNSHTGVWDAHQRILRREDTSGQSQEDRP